jgi:hypothetical protein
LRRCEGVWNSNPCEFYRKTICSRCVHANLELLVRWNSTWLPGLVRGGLVTPKAFARFQSVLRNSSQSLIQSW